MTKTDFKSVDHYIVAQPELAPYEVSKGTIRFPFSKPLSALLPGVLTTFDLPDCYRDLRKKNLKLVEMAGQVPFKELR